MLKKTIQFQDFDGNPAQETLYFNLTKSELMDLTDLQPQFEAWQAKTSGGPRELTVPEIKELLAIIKTLIEKSYGVRSDDGKRFSKSPELYRDFLDSASYDAFLFGMFEKPDEALQFMEGILPQDMLDQVKSAEAATVVELPTSQVRPSPSLNHTEEEVPVWLREDRDPTPRELTEMSPQQLRDAFQRKQEKQRAEEQARQNVTAVPSE